MTFPLMPAASTSTDSVQVRGFEEVSLLTHCVRLLCDFCSSGQCFAFGFLQIPPRGRHPCRSANCSPCRANSGLSPPSHPVTTTCTGTAPVTAPRAMPGARTRPFFAAQKIGTRTILAESPGFVDCAKRGLIVSGGVSPPGPTTGQTTGTDTRVGHHARCKHWRW